VRALMQLLLLLPEVVLSIFGNPLQGGSLFRRVACLPRGLYVLLIFFQIFNFVFSLITPLSLDLLDRFSPNRRQIVDI